MNAITILSSHSVITNNMKLMVGRLLCKDIHFLEALAILLSNQEVYDLSYDCISLQPPNNWCLKWKISHILIKWKNFKKTFEIAALLKKVTDCHAFFGISLISISISTKRFCEFSKLLLLKQISWNCYQTSEPL